METPWPSWCRRAWVPGLLLVLATLAAYQPVWHAGFVWDDDTTLTANPLIQAPDGLAKFWLSTEPIDYWPVTYTTLWAEWRVWGDAPLGYHVTNLFLHLLTVGLVWLVLRQLKIPGAWWAALLFAVHPVNVETVAWVAQRKTLLAALFFLVSVYGYARAGLVESEAPGQGGAQRGWYWMSLVAFGLAMLSKGSAATLPVVLLGLVAWRRRVAWSDGARLAPFFAVAGALTWVNIWFQANGAHAAIRHVTVVERLLGAAAAVWFYLGNAVWPAGLMFVYPSWDIRADELRWWLPLLAGVALTGLLWRWRRTGWSRAGLLAWFYFVVTLAPVMGFVDVYFMKFSLVADHYQYLSIIGVTGLAGAGLAKVMEGSETRRRMVAAGAGLVLVTLGGLTWRDCTRYADAETLWQATVAENPDCFVGWDNLGHLAFDAGRMEAATQAFQQALAIAPASGLAHDNLGAVYMRTGRVDEAIAELRQALKMQPDLVSAHYDLGNIWLQKGRADEAAREFRQALQLQPDDVAAHNNLGEAYWQAGRADEAAGEFIQALKIQPDDVAARVNLGVVYLQTGRLEEAADQFRTALKIQPAYAPAHYNLGNLRLQQGRATEAIAEYDRVLITQPNDAKTHNNLGEADKLAGRTEEAIEQFRAALKIAPDSVATHNNLGTVYGQTGRMDEAVEEYRAALKIAPDSMETHSNLGAVYEQMGRLDEAAAEYRAALASQPENAAAHYHLGSLEFQKNEIAAAMDEYRAALKIQPDFAEAHNDFGVLLEREGNYPDAIEQYQLAAAQAPGAASPKNNLAWVLATGPAAELRDGPKALALAQSADQLAGGKDPNVLDTLAAAYAETGQFDQAVQTAQAALDLARNAGNAPLVKSLQTELAFYEKQQPYRTEAKPSAATAKP